MASPICGRLLDFDLLHFTPDEVRSLNEMVMLAVTNAPDINLFHTFWTGIKNDKRIGLLPGSFGLIGKAAQGCDPTADCVTLTATEKTWAPRYIELILDQCIDDLGDSFLKLLTNDHIEVYDLTKTEVFKYILDILAKDVKDMVFRHVWFGDKDAAVAPGGLITPTVDVSYFNVIDGFFKQLDAIVTADALRGTAITGNSQATYALQKSVATPALVYADVNSLIDAADPLLAAQPDRILLVTHSVGQRLLRHLQSLGVAYKTELMTNGIQSSTWDGIPMYIIPAWDSMIAAYQNNGTKWNDPHRVVYTTKSNLNIGTAATGLFDRINSFYDQRSRINRIEAVDAFDAKILDERLVQVGT